VVAALALLLASMEVGTAQEHGAVLLTDTAIHVKAGQRVRFSGYIKTEAITRGFAALWWEEMERGRPTSVNHTADPVLGTKPWTRYEIELPPFSADVDLWFGVQMSGNGTAWFNSFQLEIDGKPDRDTRTMDPSTWIRSRRSDTTRFDIGIFRRWMRAPANDPNAERDNATTLVIRSTSS
jgi:hypothetical protein